MSAKVMTWSMTWLSILPLGGATQPWNSSKSSPVHLFLRSLVNKYTQKMENSLDNDVKECSTSQCSIPPVYGSQPMYSSWLMERNTCRSCVSNSRYMSTKPSFGGGILNTCFADWEVPSYILKGEGISPTSFILKKILREQAVLNSNFNFIVAMATICLCQPLPNAMVERGASQQ